MQTRTPVPRAPGLAECREEPDGLGWDWFLARLPAGAQATWTLLGPRQGLGTDSGVRQRGLGWDPLCPLCEFRRVRDVRPCKHAPAVSREETKPRLDPRPPSALGPGGQPALGHLAPWLRGAPRCLSCICCLSPRSRRKRAEPGVWHRAAAAPGLSGVPFFCCDGSSQAAALGSGRFLSLRTPRDRSHGGSPASPRAQRTAPLPSARRGLEPPGAQSRAVGALGHCHPILCTKGHVSLCFFSLTF